MKRKNGLFSDVHKMVQLAVLVAIIALLTFTPIGYLKAGVVEITFLQIPVVIGAIFLGPKAGAFLGGIFGLTSFLQCVGVGAVPSPFGAALLSVNPYLTAVLCIVPRILMGLLAGLIFRSFPKQKTAMRHVSYAVSSLSGALLNTLFFMTGLILLFGRTEYILNMQGGKSVLAFLAGLVGVNGLIEAAACLVIGTALCEGIGGYFRSKGRG